MGLAAFQFLRKPSETPQLLLLTHCLGPCSYKWLLTAAFTAVIFQCCAVAERTQTVSELQQLLIVFQDTAETHRAVEASFPIHGQVPTRGLALDDHHACAHRLDPQDIYRPNMTGKTQPGLFSPLVQPQKWSILGSGSAQTLTGTFSVVVVVALRIK